MFRVAVLTDSSSDLTPQQARQFGLHLMLLSIQFNGREWLDHLELTPQDMFSALPQAQGLPALRLPRVEEYLGQVQALLQTHDHVLALHTGPLIGQVYRLAFQAAQALPEQLTVFNSNTTSGGLALQARRARQMLDLGVPLEQVTGALRGIHKRQCTRICVTTLDGFRRAGLLDPVRAALGELRGKKPILGERDGKLEVLNTRRGHEAALEEMLQLLRLGARQQPEAQVVFGYNSEPEKLEPLRAAALELGVQEVFEVQFGAVLSSITGPDAYGFSLEPVHV